MSTFPRTSLTTICKTVSTLILCMALLCPAPASADLQIILQEGHNGPATDRRPKPPINAVPSVGLNDKGDLTIRYREATLIIAYAPDNTNEPEQLQILSMNHQEPPAIPGISLAFSIAF